MGDSEAEAASVVPRKGALVPQEQAIQVMESMSVSGQTTSQSGDPKEDQLLAQCLSNRAQCVLDMSEGKGVLPDGTPFKQQFEEEEHFLYFQNQALKQAEEVAEKACLLWADD